MTHAIEVVTTRLEQGVTHAIEVVTRKRLEQGVTHAIAVVTRKETGTRGDSRYRSGDKERDWNKG